MNYWASFPFVRFLIPFIVGILLAIYFPIPCLFTSYFIYGLLIIYSMLVLFPKLNFSYRKAWWLGILINIILFLSAYQLTIFKTEKFTSNHFSKYIEANQYVYARLTDPYLEKEKIVKTVLEITAVKQGNKWIQTCGKAMVSIKKDSTALQLNYGDEILIKVNFKEVPPPQNPGEFNYKRFLSFHNVNYQAYIKEGDWVFTGNNSGNILYSYANKLRTGLLKVLADNGLKGDEYAVGGALLLGYVDKLDADIITAYASTGALHVLSVSGMHVGLIYLVLNFFLIFLDKIKYGNILKATILILFIWFYATLTGLSPAVLRSAVMLSFIITGKAWRVNTNIYNTLAASAFFLFLFNPYFIMDVGFQLSYIAVLGIVYLQPKIYNWFTVDNWLLDKIWAITAVSFAAQLATFPLGLHYFHQFPNYFLLSNLIVIPISTAVIYIGIAVFALSKLPLLIKFMAIIFNWSIWFLNGSVKLIEHWPHALTQGVSITVVETWLIYATIILFLFYFIKRHFKYLILAMGVTIIILISFVLQQNNHQHQRKLIVYNIPKTSAIDFISAQNNVLLTDSIFAKNTGGLLFRVKHNWWDLSINNSTITSDSIRTNTLFINTNGAQFYDKQIIVFNKQSVIKGTHQLQIIPLKIDYLIMSANPSVSMQTVLKMYNPLEIIFDSSNSPYHITKWKAECAESKQKYYSVPDSGAFVKDI